MMNFEPKVGSLSNPFRKGFRIKTNLNLPYMRKILVLQAICERKIEKKSFFFKHTLFSFSFKNFENSILSLEVVLHKLCLHPCQRLMYNIRAQT